MLDINTLIPGNSIAEAAELIQKAERLLIRALLAGTAKYVRAAIAFLKLKYPVSYAQLSRLAELLFKIFERCRGDVADETEVANALAFVLKQLNKLPDCPAYGSSDRLIIPWRSLYDALLRVQLHYTSWEEYSLHPPVDVPIGAEARKAHGQALVSLLRRARNFFDKAAASEIVSTLRPHLCPDENGLFRAVGLLCLMLPEHVDSSFLEDAFQVFEWIPNCLEWTYLWIHFFSRLARHGDAQIVECLRAKLARLFEVLLSFVELPTSKDSSHRPELLVWPSDCSFLLAKNSYKNEAVKKMTRIVAFTLGQGSCTKGLLASLMQYLQPFFNPLNEGAWTSALDMLLKMLTLNYTKRVGFESGAHRPKRPWQPSHKFTDADISDFISIMLPLALTAFQSKDHSMSHGAAQAIKDLVSLQADVVFPTILDRLIPALENTMKPHEAVNAMEVFSVVLGPFLRSEGGLDSPLLAQMLQASLAGIDNNDPMKTVKTLRMYTRIVTLLPLIHPSDMPGGKPEVVYLMPDWSSEVLDRIWKFLSNIPSLKKGSGLEYVLGGNIFRRFLDTFFQQMSPTLYENALKQICSRALTTYYPPAKKYFGQVLSAAVYANPSALKQLVPLLYDKILHKNGADLAGNGSEAAYWVHLLGHAISRSGEHLLPFSAVLDKVIDVVMLHEEKDLRKEGQKLLWKSLRSYLVVIAEETRSLPPSSWEFAKSHSFASLAYPELPVGSVAIAFRFPNDAVQQHVQQSIDRIFSRVHKLLVPEGGTVTQANLRGCLGCLEAIIRGGASIFPDKQATFESVPVEENGFETVEDDDTVGLMPLFTPKNTAWGVEFRMKVGQLLQRLCDLHASRENPDVTSIKALIRALQAFCSHNGFKADQKGHYLNYDKASYRSWNKGFTSTFTRNLIILKAQSLLKRRMASGIWASSIDTENLLTQLLSLCTHEYSAVRKKAQKSLPVVIRRFPQFSNRVVSIALQVFVRSESTKAAVNGAIYVLNTAPHLKRIARQWNQVSDMIVGLLSAHHFEDIKVQVRLAELWNSFVPYTFRLSFSLEDEIDRTLTEIPVITSCLTLEQAHALASEGRSARMDAKSRQESAYMRLISKIENAISGNEKLHWRFVLLAASACSIFIRHEKIPSPRILDFFVQGLASEILPLRQLSRCVLPTLVRAYEISKETSNSGPMDTEPQIRALSFGDLDLHLDVAQWQGPSLDCLWKGWNSPADCRNILDDCSTSTSDVESLFQQFFNSSSLVARTCDLMASDHRLSGDERAAESEKSMAGMPLPSGAVLTLYNGCWQWPRTPAASFSSAFNKNNVFALETMLRIGKAAALNPFWPLLQAAISKFTDREQQCFAAELLCAVIRASTTWDSGIRKDIAEKLESLLAGKLQNIPMDATSDWMEAMRLIVCNRDPRRFQWLLRCVAALTKNPDVSTASLLNGLKLHQALLIEFGWRGYSFAAAITPPLLKMLGGASKTTREEAGRCLFFAAQIDIALPEFSRRWRLGYAGAASAGHSRDPLMNDFTGLCQRVTELYSKLNSAAQVDSQHSKTVHQEVEGIMYFFIHASRIGRAAPTARFMPAALRLALAVQEDPDREFAQVGKLAFHLICAVAPREVIDEILAQASAVLQQSSSWRVRIGALDAIRILAHRVPLDERLRAQAVSLLHQALLDPVLDVRQFASLCFAGLLRMSSPEEIRNIVASAPKPRKRGAKATGEDANTLTLRHSKVLAVCASILSQPTEVPEWMADAVTAVCSLHDEDPAIKQTIVKTIGEFKKTHQDVWPQISLTWTSEQLSLLADFAGSRSYYS